MIASSTQPVAPIVTTPPTAAPAVQPAAAEQVGRQIVGMSVADARAAVDQLGFDMRVSVEDGEPQVVTMDWDPTRINVGTEGEKITSFEGLG